VVSLLLQHGEDVRDDNQLLKLASARGHAHVLALLLEHGADIYSQGDFDVNDGEGVDVYDSSVEDV
jgi:ankyrin repeat protein